MSDYSFATTPHTLPASWRPLDCAVYRWVLAHGGSALLARTAACASAAHGDGDTALLLRQAGASVAGAMPLNAEDIAALRAETMVAANDEGPVRPFVLDADDRFYLWRNRRDESQVIASLRARRDAAQTLDVDTADIDVLFAGDASDAVTPQRAAVRQVAGKRLFVLTGGPGTGKTTTVLRMLLLLQRRAGTSLNIVAAAPTGKAAQRLTQALREGAQALRANGGIVSTSDGGACLDAIPQAASTLHRLLGMGGHGGPRAGAPLAADVVVVDEASMIDLAMLRALLDALREDAALILVGDADQLASIGAGAVLTDLVAALEADPRDDLVRLHHVFRSQHALAAIHQSVRSGDAAAFRAAWQAAGDAAIRHRVTDLPTLARHIDAWSQSLLTAAAPPHPDGDSAHTTAAVSAALRTLTQRQLLCALHEGPFGALAVAARIDRHLRRVRGSDDDSPWYHGRAILILHNDYHAQLFNGDVGLCLHDATGVPRVWFAASDGSVRAVAIEQLPAHESAWAITIHKSQGSEYDHVAVLLPPSPDNPILNRELLYTALSRARTRVELWSSEEATAAALNRSTTRAGGLAARLRGC